MIHFFQMSNICIVLVCNSPKTVTCLYLIGRSIGFLCSYQGRSNKCACCYGQYGTFFSHYKKIPFLYLCKIIILICCITYIFLPENKVIGLSKLYLVYRFHYFISFYFPFIFVSV